MTHEIKIECEICSLGLTLKTDILSPHPDHLPACPACSDLKPPEVGKLVPGGTPVYRGSKTRRWKILEVVDTAPALEATTGKGQPA